MAFGSLDKLWQALSLRGSLPSSGKVKGTGARCSQDPLQKDYRGLAGFFVHNYCDQLLLTPHANIAKMKNKMCSCVSSFSSTNCNWTPRYLAQVFVSEGACATSYWRKRVKKTHFKTTCGRPGSGQTLGSWPYILEYGFCDHLAVCYISVLSVRGSTMFLFFPRSVPIEVPHFTW